MINEAGATRFDVAVRAMRGELDPAPGVANTERASGLLLDSLVQWPATYEFQFVLRADGSSTEALTEEMRALVARCVLGGGPLPCLFPLHI